MLATRPSGAMVFATVLLLSAFVGAPGLQAREPSAEERTMTLQVLEAWGLTLEIQGYPAFLANQLGLTPEFRAKPDPKVHEKLEAAFEPGKLLEDLAEALVRNADLDKLSASLRLMKDPLFERVTRLQVQGGAPGASRPPRAELVARDALLHRLDAPEAGASGLLCWLTAALQGVVAAAAAGEAAGSEVPLALCRNEKERIRHLMAMRRIYAPLTLEELKRYVSLADEGIGGWLSRATCAALQQSLVRGFDRFHAALRGGKQPAAIRWVPAPKQ